MVVAIALAAFAITVYSSVGEIIGVSIALGSVALAVGLGKLQTHFERSYTRR
ncbi:MAG: hypothetical protein WA919_21375 [Coleofasciculaceae cyanobacterium]